MSIFISKQPTKLEPASQNSIVWKVSSDLATQSEFKYGWETLVGPTYSDSGINKSLGKRFFDKNPDNTGIFTTHTQLENYLGLNVQPFIFDLRGATESLTFYKTNLFESYNPNTFFYEITEDLGSNVVLNPTFSTGSTDWTLDLQNFMFFSSLGTTRAEYVGGVNKYSGKLNQLLTVEANSTYLVRVRFKLYSRNVKMRLQIVADDYFDFKDFGFYQNDTTADVIWEFDTKTDTTPVFQILALTINNTIVGLQVFSVEIEKVGNFLKLLFNDGHPFQVGDEIRINKTDKTINPQYDGFSFVTDTTTYSVVLDKEIGERSPVPQTGFIINLIRNATQSSIKWAFNGRKTYEEKFREFDKYVLIEGAGTQSDRLFLTDYTGDKKRTRLNNFETLSLIIATESMYMTEMSEKITTYNGETSSVFYLDRPLVLENGTNRIDIPTGPLNFNNGGRTPTAIIDSTTNEYCIEIVKRGILNEGYYEVNGINQTQPSSPYIRWYITDGNSGKQIKTRFNLPFSVKVYGEYETDSIPYTSYEIFNGTFSSGTTWTDVVDGVVLGSSTASTPFLNIGYSSIGSGFFTQRIGPSRLNMRFEILTSQNPAPGISLDNFKVDDPNTDLDLGNFLNSDFSNLTPELNFKTERLRDGGFNLLGIRTRGTNTRLAFQILLNGNWVNQIVSTASFTNGSWSASTAIGSVTGARGVHQLPYGVATASLLTNGQADRNYIVNTIGGDTTSDASLSEKVCYIIDKDCYFYEPIQVCWKNSLGGIDYFTFNMKNTYQSTVERSTYRKNLGFEYELGDRGEIVSNMNIDKVWTLTTDYLNNDEAIFLQSLIESPEVYIIDTENIYVPEGDNPQDYPGILIPVILSTPQYDFKSSANGDELIEYTIEARSSNRKIINI